MLNGCNLLDGAEFHVAIDNKGLWPNLTKLPNGEIVAAVYNHPSHGMGSNSDVELWVSADEGFNWSLRSKISDHPEEPNAIRMNHAVGLNAKGELVALVSGYHEGQKRPLLPVQCAISPDNGVTWRRYLLDLDDVPFGDILCLPDGRLACSLYHQASTEPRRFGATVMYSADDGRTWEDTVRIGDASETHILRLSTGVWLAAARSNCIDRMDGALPHGGGEVLYRSEDEGRTWDDGRPISPQGQENAHLLELQDGRLLCSFTSRIPGLFGVVMRMSEDGGASWGFPFTLVSTPARDWRRTDCGYPSSVQLPDGKILTAYYFGAREHPADGLPWHQRYHMGVARWVLPVTD